MRTSKEIRSDLATRFTSRTNQQIREGSVIDLINSAVAMEMESAYQAIEDAKNPHIYTNLTGDNLDHLGYMVQVPRKNGETDSNYLYRIMNWTYLKAANNNTAINDSLLSLVYSSNAQYFPGIYGAGTGIVYVIPLTYSEEDINNALKEAKEAISSVVDPSAYIEYVVPKLREVQFLIQIYTESGDLQYIKNNVLSKIMTYVNAIPPKEYLKVSEINKIGNKIDNVDYFNVAMTYIDGESYTGIKFLQEIDTKMMIGTDGISWEVIGEEAV